MTARDWLAKRAELEEAATDGPWQEISDTSGDAYYVMALEPGVDITGSGLPIGDAEWIADARTSAPAMRKALEAVLEMHYLVEGTPDCGDRCCGSTEDECAECRIYYPCPTVEAITAALEPTP